MLFAGNDETDVDVFKGGKLNIIYFSADILPSVHRIEGLSILS